MPASTADRIRTFRRLHERGCFVLPNPWDAGSARCLEQMGFAAIASTSSGMAWSQGRPDYDVDRGLVLRHLASLASAVDIPVNADFEGGFANEPGGVAENVKMACATGIAGLSIEDSVRGAAEPLYPFELAVDRIRAARAAIDAAAPGLVLTARSEGFFAGRPDLGETIRRLVAFAEAGADCVYAPGLRTRDEIVAVVRAVAPLPVNVLAPGAAFTVAELAEMGARRISVGGALARVAWAAFQAAAADIRDNGRFDTFRTATPGAELNGMFRR